MTVMDRDFVPRRSAWKLVFGATLVRSRPFGLFWVNTL
jgi:hypothetical protein